MLKKLEKEIERLSIIERNINQTIKEAPEGNLRCAKSKGYFQYYQGKKYLNKNQKNYIKQLAQKEYCLDIKTEVNKRRKKLEELAEMYREEKIVQIYEKYPPARKAIVTPFIKPIEEITKEFEEM